MTEEILSLIRSKNRCLERLMEATRELLTVPTESLTEGPADRAPLDIYDRERASVIRALELYDRKLNEIIARLPADARTPAFLEEAKAEIHRNEQLIVSVFNADDIVFRKIADAQARLTGQLATNRRSRDTLAKFKSTWMQDGGDGVDTTL